MQQSTPHKAVKSASQAALRKMQLTLHASSRTPHGASRLVLAMSAWSVETRRAPARHCRGAEVYGHTNTAMHGDESTLRPRPCVGVDATVLT